MKRRLSNGQQGGEVVITGAVTIARVAELKKLLEEAMGQASPVRVNLGHVEQVDTAGIQLFCAAHRMACNRGKTTPYSSMGHKPALLINANGRRSSGGTGRFVVVGSLTPGTKANRSLNPSSVTKAKRSLHRKPCPGDSPPDIG